MGGVPSSRGCGNCRRQKQKCDQEQPQCGRCKRRNIVCQGSGERRYLFKPHVVKSAAKHCTAARSDDSQSPRLLLVSHESRLAGALIEGLEITDPRYDLGVLGAFVSQIPGRLGTNAALDSSADAFATAFTCLRTGHSSLEMTQKYGSALSTLRQTLDDPMQAKSPGTLCAIFFLVVIQPWLGQSSSPLASHSNGVQNILKSIPITQYRNGFEVDLLKTLCFQLVFESIFNPAVKVDNHIIALIESWKIGKIRVRSQNQDIKQDEESLGAIVSLTLRSLTELSIMIRNPLLHLSQLQSHYVQVLRDLEKTRHRMYEAITSLSTATTSRGPKPTLSVKLHILNQICHGLLLTVALVLNAVLMVVDDVPLVLGLESLDLQKEVLNLAEEASRYRPLGASYMPLCLMVVWASTSDMSLRDDAERALKYWQSDFPATDCMGGVKWLREHFRHLRSKQVWLWEETV